MDRVLHGDLFHVLILILVVMLIVVVILIVSACMFRREYNTLEDEKLDGHFLGGGSIS